MQSIGKEAFSDCTSVTKIESKATTPPKCDTQALDDINKWNCTLYVPKGCMAAYQGADQWKDFFFVEEFDGSNGIDDASTNAVLLRSEDGRISITGLDDGTKVSVYGVNGELVGVGVSRNGEAIVGTRLAAGSIAVVQIGERSFKMILK